MRIIIQTKKIRTHSVWTSRPTHACSPARIMVSPLDFQDPAWFLTIFAGEPTDTDDWVVPLPSGKPILPEVKKFCLVKKSWKLMMRILVQNKFRTHWTSTRCKARKIPLTAILVSGKHPVPRFGSCSCPHPQNFSAGADG